MRAVAYGELGSSETIKPTGTAEGSAGQSCRPSCGLAGSLETVFPEADLGPTGTVVDVEHFPEGVETYGDLAVSLSSMLSQLDVSVSNSRSRTQSSGGLFPLPDSPRALEKVVGHLSVSELRVLSGVCTALNSYHGTPAAERLQLSAATRGAVEALARNVVDSGLSGEKLQGVTWGDFLDVRTVDYKGDEVRVARSFSWENIQPALPPGIGSIPLAEVCERGTLDYVLDFEKYLLPEESRVYTKPPRIFVQDDSWEAVCRGLLERGVCRLIPQSEVYQVHGKPLFSGMFGVSKEEFTASGVEIYRLIMNLVPVNKLCRNLGGDVSTLPSIVGLGNMVLGDGELLVMSSEDIKCFFYLFSIPTSWHKFMSFGRAVPTTIVGPDRGEPYYLCSLVLPMGFLSSVAIAQHVHRRVARMALHSMQPSKGPQQEMRRDRPGSTAPWVYRVYLDNYDSLEKMDPKLAQQIRGEASAESLAMRAGYEFWGLPRHPKKSVQQELVAEVQGAVIDGISGKVKPKMTKILKYLELAWVILQQGCATQKQMQVICGGLVYCAMFRRPLLGMLNKVWSFITDFEGEPPVVKHALTDPVKLELVRFLCSLPLAQMNLRSIMRGDVTASDASEYGGGFCISNGLTAMGIHAASCQVRGDVPELEDHVQVLTIGLFDGIGALRVGADVLKLPMAGHVSAEVSKEASRVLEANFPDSVHVGNVELIDDTMVQGWALQYSNVGVVLVGGGPPCQGVSGLNFDRKGALKDARSSLFTHVKRIYLLVKKWFSWAQVHYLMESVFSMDEKDRSTMSEHMECHPYMVDASGISLCRRPRLYWVSWEIVASPKVVLTWQQKPGWAGYYIVELSHEIDHDDFLKPGWTLSGEKLPTFTTSRPRDAPGNRPAGLWQCQQWEVERWKNDRYRYPPYVYRDKHGLINAERSWRLPSIQEKEAIMGFPIDYTASCMGKNLQKGEQYLDTRHTLIGNSWHVPVIAWLLQQLCYPLGLTEVHSLEAVVRASSPGGDSQLQGFLRRAPLRALRSSQPALPEEVLTKKLVNFVSIKGEDLLLQAKSENTIKFHRLRASVPGKLWKWRTICGWPWKRQGYHINVLEVEAVHTCLQWRICRKRHQRCRFLHLIDSLVALHCLSRGRSSSRKLRSVLSKINALLLAADVYPLWGYISTKQNPADRPSRRPVKKIWGKRKHI